VIFLSHDYGLIRTRTSAFTLQLFLYKREIKKVEKMGGGSQDFEIS
jgi:hypothetical protein